MKTYLAVVKDNVDATWVFRCSADDREHAREQALGEETVTDVVAVRVVTMGLPVAYRHYMCTVCKHEQEIQTNHTDQCSAICKSCSWKGIGFGAGHSIPALSSHTYRVFVFAGDDGEQTDTPHEWQISRFTETKTCSKCGLLPLDQNDIDSPCPGTETD